MANLEFSVPYNNDPETLKEIFKTKQFNNNKVVEIYMTVPQSYSGSGRVMPDTNEQDFIDVIKKIHKQNLRVNLLFNSTCEGREWYDKEVINLKMDFLGLMHEKYGVEAVTFANPIYIAEARKRFPELIICSSVLAEIDSLEKAIIHCEAGANIITPDVNINRNLKLLENIREATGVLLKPMVNEGCMHKCPYRKFHFNYTSHQSQDTVREDNMFFNECQRIIAKDLSQILKSSWIRPEDTCRYSEITNHFKIVGRGKPKSHVIRTITAYLKQEWQGDLLDLLCASLNMFAMNNGTYLDNTKLNYFNFFETVTKCGHNCYKCDYCSLLARDLVKLGQMSRHKLEDMGMKDVADRLEKKFSNYENSN